MHEGESRPGDLVVEGPDLRVVVAAPGECLIGRNDDAQIRIVDDRVSRRHAILSRTDGQWRLTDTGSSNGTYHLSRRVAWVDVSEATTVVLGGAEGVELRLTPIRDAQDASSTGPIGVPTAIHTLSPTAVVRIGRADTNDIVLTDLLVSRQHAELRPYGSGFELVDLHSGNGTYVNGRSSSSVVLNAGDLVTVGRHLLLFDGRALSEYVDTGDLRFSADELSVMLPGGKRILNEVSFSLGPRKLMAIVGPSGAGKSTLLGALTGIRPANDGTVWYGGRDLYAAYEELRHRIGLVPQQDILHQSLTVKQALEYAAELRFPADVSATERSGRVREVIEELSLTPQTNTRISSLSGGERKRASTAMELLTKPSLLFLDEPTSGLDTDLDRDVMVRLRGLAEEGRTILVVTHNLTHLDQCAMVMVLARGGHIAYLGPPDGAFAYFDVDNWTDVVAELKTRSGEEWAQRYHTQHEPRPSELVASNQVRSEPDPIAPSPSSALAQFSTLSRRYLAVSISDRTLVAIVVLLPVALAVIAHIVPAPHGLSGAYGPNTGARQLLLVLTFGAALMGAASGVRELVKERPIYRRERAMGLSLSAYVASKVVVLSAVATVQGIVLTLLALAGRPSADSASFVRHPTVEIMVAICALSAVSATIGLVISALVSDENQAMPLLVLAIMAQLVLSGGLVVITGRALLQQISWFMPTRWGFAGVASTANINQLEAGVSQPDPLWKHTPGVWLLDLSLLVGLGVLAVVVLALLVKRLDPKRSAVRRGAGNI